MINFRLQIWVQLWSFLIFYQTVLLFLIHDYMNQYLKVVTHIFAHWVSFIFLCSLFRNAFAFRHTINVIYVKEKHKCDSLHLIMIYLLCSLSQYWFQFCQHQVKRLGLGDYRSTLKSSGDLIFVDLHLAALRCTLGRRNITV